MPHSQDNVIGATRNELRVIPKETFLFPLGEERRFLTDIVFSDLPVLNPIQRELIGLTTSDDYIVAEIATDILINKGDASILNENIATFSQLVTHEDPARRICSARLLRRGDDRALPFIDQLLQDQDTNVKYVAIKALENKTFEEAFTRLIHIWESDHDIATDMNLPIAIIETIGQYNDQRVSDFLTTIDLPSFDKWIVVRAKSMLLKKSLEKESNPAEVIFDEVSNSSFEIVQNLGDYSLAITLMRENSYDIVEALESLNSHKNNARVAQLIDAIRFNWEDEDWMPSKIKKHGVIPHTDSRSRLLWSQKSLFASEDTQELIELLNAFGELVGQLRYKFSDGFIGGVIFGSTGEGYRLPTSDFDFGLLITDKVAEREINQYVDERFPNRWEKNRIPTVIYVDKDTKVFDFSDLQYLFQGVFMGDANTLHKIQLHSLRKIDEKTWDETRRKLDSMLGGVHSVRRLQERYNLSDVDASVIKQARRLVHAPPDYRTMIHLLEKRVTNY